MAPKMLKFLSFAAKIVRAESLWMPADPEASAVTAHVACSYMQTACGLRLQHYDTILASYTE